MLNDRCVREVTGFGSVLFTGDYLAVEQRYHIVNVLSIFVEQMNTFSMETGKYLASAHQHTTYIESLERRLTFGLVIHGCLCRTLLLHC